MPQTDPPGVYIGRGQISVRDNFVIQSKKFNMIDEGQNIQIGYIDVLMDATGSGSITLEMYLNYNDSNATNIDDLSSTGQVDPFFNTVVPTTNSKLNTVIGTKYWQRVYCPVRGNFITVVWTLSNAQMAGNACANDVQIDAQVIWARQAGRMTNF